MKINAKFSLIITFLLICSVPNFAETISYHEKIPNIVKVPVNPKGRINEIIPFTLQPNYNKWKTEFLSTEYGKKIWEKFSVNNNLTLNIIVSDSIKKGGQTSDYQWDSNGNLMSATIYLGDKIDKGFPDAIYYPVMNSIDEFNARKEISGTTLAATKLAHEFGHVNQTFESNQAKIQIQNKLMPIYNSIFLKNGYNVSDERLIELSNQMGGTPTQIWEDREYWGEVSAMSFLLEASKNKPFYCNLVEKISKNVNTYAIGYEERFKKVSEINSVADCKEKF